MSARIELTESQLQTIGRIESEMAWIRLKLDIKAREIEALKVMLAEAEPRKRSA